MKLFLSLLLVVNSSLAKAPVVVWDQSRLEEKPKLNKSKLYDQIVEKLNKIGEEDESALLSDRAIFIERVTNLLSWNESKNTKKKVSINSGIFLILAPKKKIITDSKEKKYESFFDNDSFGTGFLYKKYIITNFHVCRGLNTIVRDFENNIYGVKVVKYDVNQDICVYEAPKEVLGQRNFESAKMEKDLKEEAYLETKKDFAKIDFKQNKKFFAKKEPKPVIRDYAKISGIYGEDYIYKIEPDQVKDEWSKNNSYTAFGSLCAPGMSGSVIFGLNGFGGLFWGAETEETLQKRLSQRKPTSLHENNPACYFIGAKDIDKIIEEYQLEQINSNKIKNK